MLCSVQLSLIGENCFSNDLDNSLKSICKISGKKDTAKYIPYFSSDHLFNNL